MAGERGRPGLVTGEDPSKAIVQAADDHDADVLVVGNVGMSGRKEFLLGNVPNRVSHLTRRTLVIVNTAQRVEQRQKRRFGR
jgi:ubiquinone biosynthesis protein